MRRQTKRQKKSFTLAELLLATAILAFALCSLLLGFITSTFLNESSRNLTTGMTHAQYVLEDIKSTNFNNIASQINGGYWDWDAAAITSEGLTAIASEAIVVQVSGTDLLDITVTVSWKDRGVRDNSVTLETLIVEP